MLFVIATKLDVFLQLTPEMQTHLPQPLNRISFGIILRTQAPGCDEDEGIQITEMQMHQLLLMDATQWLCVRVSITPGQVVCAQAMNHFESFCGFDDCQRDLVALHLLGCGHMDSAPWNPLLSRLFICNAFLLYIGATSSLTFIYVHLHVHPASAILLSKLYVHLCSSTPAPPVPKPLAIFPVPLGKKCPDADYKTHRLSFSNEPVIKPLWVLEVEVVVVVLLLVLAIAPNLLFLLIEAFAGDGGGAAHHMSHQRQLANVEGTRILLGRRVRDAGGHLTDSQDTLERHYH
uniref:HDC06912 n=1 Tax=Drosophila melanogaster TaxID=7227 RepID=Q6IG92_DROME|nr:TPA_inf: HDC06912 [Drosophila melanogaster]